MTERVTKVSLTAQVSQYIQEFAKAERATRQAGEAAEAAAAKYQRQAQTMRAVGTRMVLVGAAAAAATAIAVKAAIDWESAWTGVTKTVDGTSEQMAVLEEDLRGLTKILPATHEEIAAVAEAAGQLGVAREDVAAFTKTMVDLSETTNLTADEAATSIAQLMNIMQTAPDDVDNLGAALVALGNDGASTERDIVQMAQRIAGSGKIIGLTEGQVLGFANALASVGIEAEAGGSSISKIMTDIAIAVSEGGEQLETFAQVAGMSSAEFQKAFRDDPADAIATFIEGLARIDAEGGDVFATLSALGQTDVRVSRALLGMANSGDLLRKSLQLGNAAWKENTALAVEAEKRYETTAAKLQIAGNAVRDAAIDFGDVFLPAVSAGAEAITAMATAWAALPQPIQTVVALTTAAGTAALVTGGLFLLALPKIVEVQNALAVLRASELPGVARAATTATNTISKTGAALGATARFITGPWGLAIAAAGIGLIELNKIMTSVAATSEEMQNSFATAADGADILATAAPGQFANITGILRDTKTQLQDLDQVLVDLDRFQNDIFARGPWNAQRNAGLAGPGDALARIGQELGTLTKADLPAAQRAFQMLAAETDGSDESLRLLLNALGPEFRNALTDVATGSGRAADEQTLLAIAMEEAKPAAQDAADGYETAADEVSRLAGELQSLIDQVNTANGVGQDAVTANARYQEALAGISEEVARQKSEYQELHGSLDGFTLSLDEGTRAGSANAAMLSEVASAAQASADATFQADLQTMSAQEATNKYAATLAAQKDAFVDSAVAAGFNRDEVQLLAEKIFALPSEHEIDMLVNNADALAKIQAVKDSLAAFKGSNYGVNISGYIRDVDGYAHGGRLPGPPSRRDNMLAMVASGEYIVNSDATTRNLPALDYINRGGVIQGFAGGGQVQPRYASDRMVVVSGPAERGGGSAPPLTVHAYGTDGDDLARKIVKKQERSLVISGVLRKGGD